MLGEKETDFEDLTEDTTTGLVTGVGKIDVSVSGKHLTVGSRRDNKAFLYDITANDISASAVELTSLGSGYFGQAVSTDGNYLAFGAPIRDTVRLYKIDPADLSGVNNEYVDITQSDGRDGYDYGFSAIIKNGFLVVGSKRDSDNGKAYLYKIDTTTLTDTANSGAYLFDLTADDINASQIKLTANDYAPAGTGRFSIGVNTDGETSVVRAERNGKVYIFKHQD